MRFAKYHGLGNDFVVVDLRTASPDVAAAIQEPSVVVAVCDRQFGVGADGVLAILPAATDADARMRVLNADGSEAEMCGNGIRCVVKELRERGGIVKDEMSIETGAGRLVCELRDGGVTVSMGAPRLLRREIPMTGPGDERCIEQTLELAGYATRTITCVSMGNPHAVIFLPEGDTTDLRQLAGTIGPIIEHHAWFPHRTNVEFVRMRGTQELDVVVWERGVGITLACGTGACATVVAATLTKRVPEGIVVQANLLGGALAIRVLPELANVRMHGPAAHVFDGNFEPRTITPRP